MQVLQDAKTCDAHGCEECRFCRTQKPAEKAAGRSIFPIGASGKRFIETSHEPDKAAQSLSTELQPFGIAEKILFFGAAGEGIDFAMDGRGEQSHPASRTLFGRPCSRGFRIDPYYHVDMVAHHGVGVGADGKDFGKLKKSAIHPLSPMLAGLSVVWINTAHPGPSHASRDAVVEAWRCRINKETASGRHSNRVAEPARPVCRKSLTSRVGKLRKCGCPDLALRCPDLALDVPILRYGIVDVPILRCDMPRLAVR